jgi:hypothetical protein
MNPRERILAMMLVVVIIGAVGGLGVWKFYLPMLEARDNELADLDQRSIAKEKSVQDMIKKKSQFAKWLQISLPKDKDKDDVHMAWGEYNTYLSDLLQKSKFGPGAMSIKYSKPEAGGTGGQALRGKKPVFTRLTYTIDGHGNLGQLVTFRSCTRSRAFRSASRGPPARA